MISSQRDKERASGARWFNGLDNSDKGDIGDELVLGLFDWRDWFNVKPSGAFLTGVESARMDWEI